MSQSNSEMNFLNKAKWLEFYGVDMQKVLVSYLKDEFKKSLIQNHENFKSEDNVDFNIGLTPTGISVYKNKTKINSYFWPRINKLDYKSCKFMLTVIDKAV